MTSDIAIYGLSIMTILAMEVCLSHSESSELDISFNNPEELDSKMDHMRNIYSIYDAEDIPDKRRSLFRFGKRRSLFRFGKRGSLLRFGKRFGYLDNDFSPIVPGEMYGFDSQQDGFDEPEKRSSIFRFGKKSRNTDKFLERNAPKEKKPHTPWRFGREEDYLDNFALAKE